MFILRMISETSIEEDGFLSFMDSRKVSDKIPDTERLELLIKLYTFMKMNNADFILGENRLNKDRK